MLLQLAIAATLALQVRIGIDTTGGDTTRSISIGAGGGRARRIPVTAQHLATAFRDSAARKLLRTARAARMAQDSAIVSYDAMSYQRISAGLGVGRMGRDRLIFRTENAARVRWHRDVGAYVDVRGSRTAMPGVPREGREDAEQDVHDEAGDFAPLPYYPGQEALWIGTGVAKADVNEAELVHPLANGAEAYYTYESGDAAGFRLPDGREVRLRELKVRPRVVRWNVVVGSLWFDADRGQLVRAAYRLAEPIDIWAQARQDDSTAGDDVPVFVKPMLSPLRGQVTAIAVEYGLHQGRFWLPRLQAAEGNAQASFMRIPFRMEQSFRYTAVNAEGIRDSMPATIPVAQATLDRRILDSLPEDQRERWRDSVRAARRTAARARRDSLRDSLITRVAACDTGTHRTVIESRGDGSIPVFARIPCDVHALATSPDLPGSIYGDGEELFDSDARQALIDQALALGAQAAYGPQRPVVSYGLQYTRFNRIEGLSLGVGATQQLGAGYVADGTLRLGVADLEPNVELGLARTNLARTVRIGAYNRLVAANDWGNPLSFGSSMSALLWGRDDGFYYRASGVDVTLTREQGAVFTWRLFGEQQRNAAVDNTFSLAKVVGGKEFLPNIVTARGAWAGASLRAVRTLGLDPRGWRAYGDVRLEGAGGESGFGRAAMDLTVSRALGPAGSAAPLAAVTASAGSSVGAVPVQRLWYLGGTHTVRGQPAGTGVGDSYWFGRLELAQELNVARVALFGDAGWAGARDAFSSSRAMSGAGVGVGILDGLLRLDVAKGIYPSTRWRTDLYLEARF